MSAIWGPRLESDGTRFRLWAPGREAVQMKIGDGAPVAMQRRADGWHEAKALAPAGTPYQFLIDDVAVPDPASRAQNGDASVVCDPASYAWADEHWRGRPWGEVVLYELHVGLSGGFDGVARKLPDLAALGITAIELMPIADFPGSRNWGYDGVLPFAPEESYGTPNGLKALIDQAHSLGLMVFLDVVYNHFGPQGNYLPLYAPEFFRSDRHTPWGDGIDFQRPEVRRFFIENALYWIGEFHVDGLRLDAVHAIGDDGFLRALAREVRAAAADRHVHLVLENEKNDAELLVDGFDAQWNDDIHHALHVLLTGESAGYYADYADDTVQKLARALSEGFVYQGEHAPNHGAARGTPSRHLPPTSFVAFLQNHDHIGNRALGERLITLADPAALKAATALVLLCPHIPLLFMGEEVGARAPFYYFSDHADPELANAVREGRRNEFAKFPEFSKPENREKIPDPNAERTFDASRIDPDTRDALEWRSFYAQLLALRQRAIVPRLKGACALQARVVGAKAVVASWRMGDGAILTLATNLDDAAVATDLPKTLPLWGPSDRSSIAPHSTSCWIETK